MINAGCSGRKLCKLIPMMYNFSFLNGIISDLNTEGNEAPCSYFVIGCFRYFTIPMNMAMVGSVCTTV